MRQHLAELLSSAVSASYGPYYGTIFSALATRSRITLAELTRAVPQLGTGDVRLALVTLVQQHLVSHHTDENGAVSYEPNWETAYNFTCRLPLLRKSVEERYDRNVARIFHDISTAGVVSVGDLVAGLMPTAVESCTLTSNGAQHTAADSITRASRATSEQEKELYGALSLLLSVGYIMKVNLRQFWPPYDRDSEAIGEIMAVQFPGGASVKKDKENLRMESDKLLRTWRNEDESYAPSTKVTEGQNPRKRVYSPDHSVGDNDRPSKRQQGAGNLPISTGQCRTWLSAHQDPISHDLVLAVNYEKCTVGLRTNMLVRHCERYVNASTSKVYEALLRRLEEQIPRCYDLLQENKFERKFFGPAGFQYEDPRSIDLGHSPLVSTREVTHLLDPNADISHLAPEPGDEAVADSIETTTSFNAHTTDTIRNDEGTPVASRARKVEQHLRTLVCDPQGFVQAWQGQWRVPLHSLSQRLIEAEIETIITHTFGTLPARIVRILKFYGHQELRHLASRAMVTEDQARAACTLLQQAGWIDVVELPRTARREVTKSLWLWSYDVLKARQKCLVDCYFTMSRLSMRLERERQDIERVIDKSERTDVQGNEDKFLSQAEKEALAKFGRQTDKITTQMIRMDEVVAIMRDFSAMEYPHKLWDHSWIAFQSPSPEGTTAKRGGGADAADDEHDDEDVDDDADDAFLEG